MRGSRSRPVSVGHWIGRDSGNVTIIFSLALVLILSGAGIAIDYARMLQQKTAFAAAADSAVLAAVGAAIEAEKAGHNPIAPLAKTAALNAWKSNLTMAEIDLATPPDINVTKSGSAWTAKLDFNEDYPTTFMSLVGFKTMKVAGSSQASTTVDKIPEFWDINVVVDDSSSMGIGATQADMDALIANPKIGCAFACHWADYSTGGSDSASIAKSAGIKLRVDVVDDAVDAMVKDLQTASTANNIRASLWGLNTTVNELVALTTKLNDVKDFNIELYKTPVSVGNTNYGPALSALTTEVGKSGDGKSAVSAKKAVFIVTDGIHDSKLKESNSIVNWKDHYTGPMDPAFCTQIKDSGVLLGVLYINYITPAGFDGVIDPFKADVLPNLKACASDGLFFNATTPEGISKAMQDMLVAAFGAGTVRLTD